MPFDYEQCVADGHRAITTTGVSVTDVTFLPSAKRYVGVVTKTVCIWWETGRLHTGGIADSVGELRNLPKETYVVLSECGELRAVLRDTSLESAQKCAARHEGKLAKLVYVDAQP